MQYKVVELDQVITREAGRLVKKYPLRAYDSVQLASAMRVNQIYANMAPDLFAFVSADDRLVSVARSEGMNVENPNDYQHQYFGDVVI
jgi:uncharacterized protein